MPSIVLIKPGVLSEVRVQNRRTVNEVINSIENSVLERLGISSIGGYDSLTLIAIKDEKILECWLKSDSKWILQKIYPFTGYSGDLGPKLRRGDRQIPEGIYGVEYLNPNSRFYLSFKLNYPNATDILNAERDKRTDLGDDIFIHGDRVTIGCIPVGDKKIEELFYLVAKLGKRNVKVIISPIDFRKTRDIPIGTKDWVTELYNDISKEMEVFR
ncbi:Uncharacterized protein CHISP_1474 [Chitinispirillum alkaliphilum]|nr:Uncharacterized protein CHISP_1474 [Chitinispirillum alkaliphilum]